MGEISATNYQERAAGRTQTRVGFGSSPEKTVGPIVLGALDTAGGVLAWANPEGASIIVKELVLNVTTVSTGACTLDAGVAANGTTLSDTLIDGLDSHSAAIVGNSSVGGGSNGLGAQLCTSTQFVTASMASGAAAGTKGTAFITYFLA